MRNRLIAFALATGLVGFGAVGASAAPLAPAHVSAETAKTQLADWNNGPRSDYSDHRRGEERNGSREHQPYNGNNRGNDRSYGNNRGNDRSYGNDRGNDRSYGNTGYR